MKAGKMNYALELPNRCEYCGNDRAHCKSRACSKKRQRAWAEVKNNEKSAALRLQKSDGSSDL
jgi:hypothetical protein